MNSHYQSDVTAFSIIYTESESVELVVFLCPFASSVNHCKMDPASLLVYPVGNRLNVSFFTEGTFLQLDFPPMIGGMVPTITAMKKTSAPAKM
jgi:hypothetical protein